jgi:hypothetical protein
MVLKNLLQLVLQYGLTKEEAFAWNLSIVYLELVKQYFPELRQYRVGLGDPRKKEIWRYCWKLYQETKGKLKKEEYRYYIQAQLAIFKKFKEDQPYIHPSRLTGPKAWARWMVWKKYFDALKTLHPAPKTDCVKETKLRLAETYYALRLRIGDLNKENLIKSMETGLLFRLVSLKVISPHFLIFSPTVQEFIKTNNIDLKKYGFDPELFKVTEELEKFYNVMFTQI